MSLKSASLILGFACLGYVSACSSDSSKETKPFVSPGTGTSNGDDNGGSNGANNGDANGDTNGAAADGGETGNQNNGPDAGGEVSTDAGTTGPLDAGGGLDASAGGGDAGPSLDAGNTGGGSDAGSTGNGGSDAGSTGNGGSDAGSTSNGGSDAGSSGNGGSDAGSTGNGGSDAGSSDAGSSDAGSGDAGSDPDAGPTCGAENVIGGNSCAGVVTCQDENFSGDPILECVLTGAAPSRCCTTSFGASDSCRTNACANGDQEAKCDGPEDCGAGAPGGLCCFNAGAAVCAATCSNPNRMCHSDADCATGTKCRAGSNAQGTSYSWWGFCRGT